MNKQEEQKNELNMLERINHLYFKPYKAKERENEFYDYCKFIEKRLGEYQELEMRDIIFQSFDPPMYEREIRVIERIRELYREKQTKELMQEFHNLKLFLEQRFRYYQIIELGKIDFWAQEMDRKAAFKSDADLIH